MAQRHTVELQTESLPTSALDRALLQRQSVLPAALATLASNPALTRAAQALVAALRAGGTVLVAGNGGSAAEAQHFAAELVGRFKRERGPYAAIALTVDSSILTAVANDYGYEQVFARQIAALGRPGDLFIAYSTSGESENLILAARQARGQGMQVLAVTGERFSRLAGLADIALQIAAPDTALTQEIHMMVTHLLCEAAEEALSERES